MTSFFVPGIPAPQGSKRLVRNKAGHTIMLDANTKTLKEWRRTVTFMATTFAGRYVEYDPLGIELEFVMPATLKERTGWCTKRPDLDKLCRAVLDGLTDSRLIHDDSQIVQLSATKVRGIRTGVNVRIERLADV